MKTKLLIRVTHWFILTLMVFIQSPIFAQEWKLVWSDEFNYTGEPDSTKWNYEVGFAPNQELEFYTKSRKENVRVEDGFLVLEAHKEKWKNPNYQPGASQQRRQQHLEYADYTSGRINTRGKASWTYGKIEARAKLPQGRGVWPAFWMLGMQGGWPACGEIDIMEYVGFDPNTIHANVHMAKYNHVKGNGKGSKITADKPYDSFHVYAIEWTAEKIDFFFDGQKYFTFENEHSGDDAWPFDRPEFIILNLAVGGNWGGQEGVDDSIFPQKYLIDYVRVYQK
jgi:beta-glucanase (GH16 family)